MRTKSLGIVLCMIGLVMILFTGFDLITTKKVVDLGPVQINKNESHPVKWSPIIGAILIFSGIIVVVSNKRKMT